MNIDYDVQSQLGRQEHTQCEKGSVHWIMKHLQIETEHKLTIKYEA